MGLARIWQGVWLACFVGLWQVRSGVNAAISCGGMQARHTGTTNTQDVIDPSFYLGVGARKSNRGAEHSDC